MNRLTGSRGAWLPQTKEERDAVLREVDAVLASPHFCNSKRYPALLQFIVRSTLAGKAEMLKERTLGVEIFGRPQTYDTSADPIVRYTAGEVRKRLLLYYSEHGHNANIRISLPAGSYIPEFLHGPSEGAVSRIDSGAWHASGAVDSLKQGDDAREQPKSGPAIPSALKLATADESKVAGTTVSVKPAKARLTRLLWPSLVIVGVCILAAAWWRYRAAQPQTPVDAFWAPVLRDQRTAVICTGSVVFSQDKYSGVTTADKDVEYTFVSMQNASAIAQVSGELERSGVSDRLVPSSTTPLTELRDHSVILLGGYNNQWTIRLLQPLRYHFSPEPNHTIVDSTQPQFQLERDHSLPYSSADDYAIVARFRDAVTDSWVVVLAGIGRNGTEAAAQFATSPHYMRLLQEQVGISLSNRNIEAVLKVNVIDGKTGAPSLLVAHTW